MKVLASIESSGKFQSMHTLWIIGACLLFAGTSLSTSLTFCDGSFSRPNCTTTARPGNTTTTTTARPGNSTTPTPSRNRCNGMPDETLFPSVNDCSLFVTCQNGLEVELECRPEGTLYDHEREVCDHPDNVICYEHDRCSEETDGSIIPAEDCANFLICLNGVKSEEVTCVPEGTLFDYQRGVCDHPSNVVCWGSSGPNLCIGKPDGALIPSVECSNFFVCTNQEPGEEITCVPEGTVFDHEREVCDFPENVVCWTPDSGTGNGTTPAPGPTDSPTRPPRPDDIPHDFCRGIVIDALAHPSGDCTRFVVCILGQPTVEHCPPNYIFYPTVGVCGYGNTETCEVDERWLEEYYRKQSLNELE